VCRVPGYICYLLGISLLLSVRYEYIYLTVVTTSCTPNIKPHKAGFSSFILQETPCCSTRRSFSHRLKAGEYSSIKKTLPGLSLQFISLHQFRTTQKLPGRSQANNYCFWTLCKTPVRSGSHRHLHEKCPDEKSFFQSLARLRSSTSSPVSSTFLI
jgi:hypothetical protein